MSVNQSRSTLSLCLLLILVALPTSLRAQTASPVSTATEARATGPRALTSEVTWGVQPPAANDAMAPQSRPHAGKDVAMMVVGGAAIVVGSIVGGSGGTIIAVSGGVIGLIGLYHYLK